MGDNTTTATVARARPYSARFGWIRFDWAGKGSFRFEPVCLIRFGAVGPILFSSVRYGPAGFGYIELILARLKPVSVSFSSVVFCPVRPDPFRLGLVLFGSIRLCSVLSGSVRIASCLFKLDWL